MKYSHILCLVAMASIILLCLSCGSHSNFYTYNQGPDVIPPQSRSQHTPQSNNFEASSFSANKLSLESAMGFKIGKDDDLQLLNELYSWMGVRYKYAGNDKNGTDCSGLICNIYDKIYHKKLDRTSNGQFVNNCKRISSSQLRQGDLVFFTINNKTINHVGLYIKQNKFIHASTHQGVIVSDMEEPYYRKYFYCAGRVK